VEVICKKVYFSNSDVDRHIVAIEPIVRGEEITIHYGKAEGTQLQRQWNLERRYGFRCTCECCKLEGEALMASDDRRIEIGRLDEVLARNDTIHGFRPIPDLTPIRDLLSLHAKEGQGNPAPPTSVSTLHVSRPFMVT
jgi:hypothetical protein